MLARKVFAQRCTAACKRSAGSLSRCMSSNPMYGKGRTALFVCDIQEAFASRILEMDQVVHTSGFMCDVAQILDIPIVVTEQYPKALGSTVEALQSQVLKPTNATLGAGKDGDAVRVFDKLRFSMVSDDVMRHVEATPQPAWAVEDGLEGPLARVVLVGIEAHVCVQGTALDLLERGIDVHVVAEGVSSQRRLDRSVALERMRQAGACITTAEAAALALVRGADHPNFKQVSKRLIKHNADRDNTLDFM